MPRYAVITDDAAQGVNNNPGGNIVLLTLNHQYPLKPQDSGGLLPLTRKPTIALPAQEYLFTFLTGVIADYDEVFCITTSAALSPLYREINKVVENQKGRAHFRLIDSQSFAAGQGGLVNKAIELIQKGKSPRQVEETIRQVIPNIYSLFGSPNLSYLYTQGFVDSGQLIAGEQYDLLPVFSLENGALNSLDKFKNIRGVTEYLLEFLEEYESIASLQFVHPAQQHLSLAHELNEYLAENLDFSQCTESHANTFLENLIGPDGFAMILIEG